MDAYQSHTSQVPYSDDHPILLFASSDAAMERADSALQASGLRVGAALPIQAASERITNQGKASAVWIELDRDCGSPLDDLLDQIRRDVVESRYGAIVSADLSLVDTLGALIDDSSIELIADADSADRIAALATVKAQRAIRSRLYDVTNDGNAERLRQLSDEVSRIASALARLSTGPARSAPEIEHVPEGEAPLLSGETVRAVIRARRLRARYFREELFADPAWDMLLDLLQAEIAQFRVPVSSLCIAAAVPATTALRWLKAMVSEGLFLRRPDPHDGRRVFVELAPETSQALRRYFAEVGQLAVI